MGGIKVLFIGGTGIISSACSRRACSKPVLAHQSPGDSPELGTIASRNITSDPETGIASPVVQQAYLGLADEYFDTAKQTLRERSASFAFPATSSRSRSSS